MPSGKVKLYANSETKVVHSNKPNDACLVGAIKRRHKVAFTNVNEAADNGYRKCERCFPKLR